MLKLDTNDLVSLLKQTQRKTTIGGKNAPQVCGVKLSNDLESRSCFSLWIVKDGVSSLSKFSVPYISWDWDSPSKDIYLPDIDRVLGILKYHGGTLRITQTNKQDKLQFASGSKQTTIQTSPDALAFPSSRDTLKVWAEKSKKRSESIVSPSNVSKGNEKAGYITKDGKTLEAMCSIKVDALQLFEAFRCGGINGQKSNLFTFIVGEHGMEYLTVEVGGDLKGKTVSSIDILHWDYGTENLERFTVSYNGGLGEAFKHINGEVWLHFFDFTEYGQGIAMFIAWGNNFILQAPFEPTKVTA